MLYATNSEEEAVEAALGALRQAVTTENPATVAGAVTSVLARWRRLDRESPYRTGALQEATLLIDAYGAEDRSRAQHLLPHREMLAATRARQSVADLMRSARTRLRLSVRQAATLADVSPSYLSELEGAQRGLPSAEVASRLDEVLAVTVSEVVAEARAEAERLQEERLRTAGELDAPTLEADPRLDDAAAALRRDPSLLDLLEQARRLDALERRAVLALMRELTS